MKFTVKFLPATRGRPLTCTWDEICNLLGREYAKHLGLRRRRTDKPIVASTTGGSPIRIRKVIGA